MKECKKNAGENPISGISAIRGSILRKLPIYDRLLVDAKIAKGTIGGYRTGKLRDIAKKVISSRLKESYDVKDNERLISAYGINVAKELAAERLQAIAREVRSYGKSTKNSIEKYRKSSDPQIVALVDDTLRQEFRKTLTDERDFTRMHTYESAAEDFAHLEKKMRECGMNSEAKDAAMQAIYYMIVGNHAWLYGKDIDKYLLTADEKRAIAQKAIIKVQELSATNFFDQHERIGIAKSLAIRAKSLNVPEVLAFAINCLEKNNAGDHEISELAGQILDMGMAQELKKDEKSLECVKKAISASWGPVHIAEFLLAIGETNDGKSMIERLALDMELSSEFEKSILVGDILRIAKKYGMRYLGIRYASKAIDLDIEAGKYESAEKIANDWGFENIALQLSAIRNALSESAQ